MPIPKAPDDLSDAAKECWNELRPELEGKCEGIAPRLLRDMLRQYCEAFATRQLAQFELRRLASTIIIRGGTTNKAPQFSVIEQCEKTMDRVFRRLGMQQKVKDGPEEIDV